MALNSRTLRIVIFSILGAVVVFVVVLLFITPQPSWTGFGKTSTKENVVPAKTFWDWLELLIIPIIIAVAAWLYKESEKKKSEIIEYEKVQNEIVDSFFNVMTDLITNHDLIEGSNKATNVLARARINVAFSVLDGARKGQVLQFLYHSDFIDIDPKISLIGSNLNDVVLDGINMASCEIRGAHFENSSVINANLNDSVLVGCNFKGSDFTNTTVENTDLSYCNLQGTHLNNMDLTSVNLEGADITDADLSEATILKSQLAGIFMKENIILTNTNVL